MTLPVILAMRVDIFSITLCLAACGLWVTYTDFREFRIANTANLAVLLLGIIAVTLSKSDALVVHVITGGVAWGVFWAIGHFLFTHYGRDVLGQGDAKLIGAGSVWVGPLGVPSVLLLAALAAIAFALLAGRMKQRIPFGPFLALAIYAVWLHGSVEIF